MANLPLIQGKKPDSKEEVWMANSLYKYKVQFIYQYAVAGGTRVRRGVVIDFLLLKPTQPLEVYGDYWHENELPGGDLIRLKTIEEFFGVAPLIIWGNEMKSPTAVDQWVRRNVAR